MHRHILNTENTRVLSAHDTPHNILTQVGATFTSYSVRGDFSIINTTHSEQLRAFTEKHLLPNIYTEWIKFRHPTHIAPARPLNDLLELRPHIEFQHSFYPYTLEEQHLLDMKAMMLSLPPELQEEGLSLLSKTVELHYPPRVSSYSIPLCGLSYAAHDLSEYSSPIRIPGQPLLAEPLLTRYNAKPSKLTVYLQEELNPVVPPLLTESGGC